MKPFARINLSSVLSSVALAKGDALRRGSGKCENVKISNIQYPLFNDGGANWILAVGCWIFAHSTHAFFPFARCGGQGETNTTKET